MKKAINITVNGVIEATIPVVNWNEVDDIMSPYVGVDGATFTPCSPYKTFGGRHCISGYVIKNNKRWTL